ncbi:MAG: stage II sporulation protein M [Saprospiraceae bacterium]|nr:stage II sporulation protein M [Saprospiraceae bacterium]MBL0101463.1 stage II sporulation protein M [Saprospiraceae bacterium]
MREVAFIKRNKQKWLDFEQAILGKVKKNPDDLADLYIQLVNDLSFAQTYYPKSKTVVYLNHLAATAFQQIYKTKRTDTNQLSSFFKVEVPYIIRQNRRFLVYAFVLFFISVSLGVLSAIYDDSFVRLILGDEYVDLTLDNIKKGDPVAIYKSGSNWGSFIGITMNNLQVGLKCFVYGVTGGFGTMYIMFHNGIMLGSFQTFFAQQDVFWESVRGIWIHGAMEIFAIVIETMAGLILGASILFPGTYSRLDSFKSGMRKGLKIWLSTMPFTIMAGFLEGFITRYSNVMPNVVSAGIILMTLSLISWYYLVYPFRQMDIEKIDI